MQTVCVATLVLGGCVRRLPPAPVPEPVTPQVDVNTPVPSGYGRLVIDVVDGAAPVQRIQMRPEAVDAGNGRTSFRFSEAPELLCAAAPCVAQVPLGNVLLGFPVMGNNQSIESELVHVGTEPTVYRRALSYYNGDTGATRVLGIIGTSLGGAATITGMALLPAGLSRDNDGVATAGGITLGGGLVLLAVGIYAIWSDSPVYRPGSSHHYPLASPAR